jgi:hypothetical protein
MHQDQTKNSTRIDLGPYQKKFGYHETIMTSPHARKNEIDNFRSELMNCTNFRGRNLLMRYKTCSPQR